MITFVSDLDNTLIYSKQSDGSCVEWKSEQEISFMTDFARKRFLDLLERENFRFIPCTARSRDLAMRISFLQEKEPEFMICDHGGSIYRRGERDSKWEQYLHEQNVIHPDLVDSHYERIQVFLEKHDLSYRSLSYNQPFFFVISFETAKEAMFTYNLFKQYEQDARFIWVCQGRKIYYLPVKLDKSLALSYLKETYGMHFLVTSGDSCFDERFTALGDRIFLPEHATFHHSKEIRSQSSGITAGEELVRYLETLLSK